MQHDVQWHDPLSKVTNVTTQNDKRSPPLYITNTHWNWHQIHSAAGSASALYHSGATQMSLTTKTYHCPTFNIIVDETAVMTDSTPRQWRSSTVLIYKQGHILYRQYRIALITYQPSYYCALETPIWPISMLMQFVHMLFSLLSTFMFQYVVFILWDVSEVDSLTAKPRLYLCSSWMGGFAMACCKRSACDRSRSSSTWHTPIPPFGNNATYMLRIVVYHISHICVSRYDVCVKFNIHMRGKHTIAYNQIMPRSWSTAGGNVEESQPQLEQTCKMNSIHIGGASFFMYDTRKGIAAE